MEEKLISAAAELPHAATDFAVLENMAAAKKKRIGVGKMKVILAAAAVCILLCGMGWAKVNMGYGMWTLGASTAWNDASRAAEKLGLVLPETLDGAPFLKYRSFSLVPHGTSWLEALINPSYKPHSVDYGVEVTETETYADGSRSGATVTVKGLNVDFGTTENDLWRYYFGFDEEGNWTAYEVPDSYCTFEYKGITLQVGDTFFYDDYLGCDRYTRWVHWVDEELQTAVSISESDYTDPDRVVECAKYIIDMNS